MMVHIFLKGGGNFIVNVEEFTTRRDKFTNELAGIVWKDSPDWQTKLHMIEVNQIAAVIVHADPEPVVPKVGRPDYKGQPL